MTKKYRKGVLALLAVVATLALTVVVLGRSAGPPDVHWSTIAGGGGESTGGGYTVSDSLGQPAASDDPSTGGGRYSLGDGFWQIGSTRAKLYLPMVVHDGS